MRLNFASKNVQFEGPDDYQWSKQGRQWISHAKISIKSGITLACRRRTQNVRIFIFHHGRRRPYLIWLLRQNWQDGGKAPRWFFMSRYPLPKIKWEIPQHHFVNGSLCQVQDYQGLMPQEQRQFATTLHYYSPKTYNCRKQLPLPASSTLRRWSSTTDWILWASVCLPKAESGQRSMAI